MGKIKIIIRLFLLVIFVELIYGITIYAEPARNKVVEILHLPGGSVKGASTQRAQEITSELGSDIGSQVDTAKKQALNIKVSDALSVLTRLQKIPQDAHAVEEYIRDQVGNVLKSKK